VTVNIYKKEILKSFGTLDEDQKIECLYEIIKEHNHDFSNNRFLKLLAPPRANTLFGRPYTSSCKCGHSSSRHWEIHGDLKECKNCDCAGFYE